MTRSAPIYLDGFSTLPLAPEARDAMLAAWAAPGNAGSPHAAGDRAARTIEDARAAIGDVIGAAPSEIIFTSGATEANNLALLGSARQAVREGNPRRRLIVSAIEHKSVIEAALALEAEGFSTIFAPVDTHGLVDVDALAALTDEKTLLVSVMAANNETGVIQPVAEAAAVARRAGALFHCDGAQAFGKIPIHVGDLGVDFLSLSGHKCYGPMGIGALYVAAGSPKPRSLMFGGGQQSSMRPGTEPVPLIAGFGAAAQLAGRRQAADYHHGQRLAAEFLDLLAARQTRVCRITGEHAVIPGSLSISLDGADADMICARLARDVQLSTGSACNSGQLRMSHVLESMGYSEGSSREVLRIFFNRYTADDEVGAAAEAISVAAARSSLATGELRQ